MYLAEKEITDLFEKNKYHLRKENFMEIYEKQKEKVNVQLETGPFTIKIMQQSFAYIEKGLSSRILIPMSTSFQDYRDFLQCF